MLKTYTGTFAKLIEEYLMENNIIFPEQAGAKKGQLGCTDQLLINRVVTDEIKKGRKKNLCMLWLDYKKAYDSVPHAWILEALHWVKVLEKIILAIEHLIGKWKTELNIPTVDGNVMIGDIIYNKGMLQGNFVSVILLILSLNPLSFLLNKTDGYKIGLGTLVEKILTYLFFVDDLKLFAPNLDQSKLQLDIVTQFSKDIGMEFGEDKCSYIYIECGKKKTQGELIKVNEVTIKELEEGKRYRYFGQDKSIGYDGKLNKERVEKEYYRQVRRIWSSELNAKNKVIAHNSFAVPFLTPTIGILDLSLAEMENVDKKTRRILCMTGTFHWNSDVNRLYLKRTEKGRGLKSFEETYISRIVSLKRHIERDRDKNHYLENAHHYEKDRIMRPRNEYEKLYLVEHTEGENTRQTLKTTSDKIKQRLCESNKEKWLKKPQHGYLHSKTYKNENINHKASNLWIKEGKFSSHVEGFLFAIQEQEIDTKGLQKMREKNKDLRATMPSLCRRRNHLSHYKLLYLPQPQSVPPCEAQPRSQNHL